MSDWNMSALREQVEQRRRLRQAGSVDEIVLAFARWRGRTQELGCNREAEKQKLDSLLDGIDPDAWSELKELVGLVDDRLLKEVMVYSSRRSLEQLKQEGEEPSPPSPDPAGPPMKKKRRFRF